MRRPALFVVIVGLLGSCHRVTGLDGIAGEARHGNGYYILASIYLWAALVAIVAGLGFLVHALARGTGPTHVVWSSVLLSVGVVLLLGTLVSSTGLLICHGTC